MMKLLRAAMAAMMILLFASCSGGFRMISAGTGSNLSPDGTISDSSLAYSFRNPGDLKTNKDLFNFMYFEGDTVCFSFRFSRPVTEKQVSAYFVDPPSGKAFPAERLDIHDGVTVSGFSLTGSLMEQFFAETISRPADPASLRGREIPFTVRLLVALPEKTGTFETKGTFRIEYR
jgi:hypothetical protein